MPGYDNKLDKFINAIIDDASTEAEKIRDEISSRKKEYMSAAEDDILAEMYNYIRTTINQIKTDAGRRVSRKTLEIKRTLAERRAEIAKNILEKVRARVIDYTLSPEYSKSLEKMAEYAKKRLGSDGLVIYLRAEDMKYSKALNEKVPAEYLEGKISLGGILAGSKSQNIRVDLTFDNSFEDVSGKFAEISGLGLHDEE